MTKWADYLISAVRYEETETTKHISELKVYPDYSDGMGVEQIWSRQSVINAIDEEKTFKTIYINRDGKWVMGEDVRKVKVGKDYFLRTDANSKDKDNLGDLPEF